MRSIRSTRFWRPCSELLGEGRNEITGQTHLSGPGGEILEGPPGPLFFLRLFDLLGDIHDSRRRSRMRERNETWGEGRAIYISTGGGEAGKWKD